MITATSSLLGVDFSGTISLGVLLLGLLASGLAIWRTQSIAALRQANDDLRNDRNDWKLRYEDQVTENHRLESRIATVLNSCQTLEVEVARLQERTDTTLLAKEAVVAAFRDEMRAAVLRLETLDTAKLDLLRQQGEMISTLITRDPALRTRSSDELIEGAK